MKVKGSNVVVFIDRDGQGVIYGCALAANLNLTTEFIETSVSGTGNFATFLPTKNSFTGTIEGLTNLDDPSMITLPDLRKKQINQEELLMQYQLTDEEGNLYTEEGSFYISNSTFDGRFGDMSHFSIELRGTGALTALYYFTHVEDTVTPLFADSELIDRTIVRVTRDGDEYTVITSGIPAIDEVVYTAASGRFDFLVNMTPGTVVIVTYY